MKNILEELKKREPIFHRPEFGTTRADFEKMTVEDYWEIGASGNRYEREDCIDTVVKRYQEPDYIKHDFWETNDFECRQLSDDTYLLTYTLIQGKEKRVTKRSTIKNMENIVVTTDASIICSEENLKILSQEFVVYLKVNIETKNNRTHPNRTRNFTPFLCDDFTNFLTALHKERDSIYELAASFSIDTNDSDLENHVQKTVKIIKKKNDYVEQDFSIYYELVLFHKMTHTPVQLNKKQSECLMLLASGKSSKEIADMMHLSSRTIEYHIQKLMEILGCASSKELIALYYDQP